MENDLPDDFNPANYCEGKDAAPLLHMSLKTLNRHRRDGELPAGTFYRVGGCFRYNVRKIIKTRLNRGF